MEKNITIKEIAKKAGVSHTVVSAVLNRKENKKVFVSEQKKREILSLIEKYGYVPNKRARDLVKRKTNTIGLIIHRLTPYFSFLIEDLQKQAFKIGLEILPYISEGLPEKEEEYLSIMRDGRVDGVLVAGMVKGSKERYLKYTSPPYNLKLVTILIPPIENIPSVSIDEENVGILAAQHLIDKGYKRLYAFGGEKSSLRMRSFVEYAKEKNIDAKIFTEEYFVGYYEQGRKLAKKLLKEKEIPDGIFTFNDLLGVALINELLNAGIKVPEEIGIVSCDNTELCRYTFPELTSIDNNVKRLAQISIEKIKAEIDNKELREIHTKTEPKLIKRGST